MPEGTIIVLNGPSSAGKSTLALALKDALGYPCAHIAYDALSSMLPRAIGRADYGCLTRSVLATVYHMARGLSECRLAVIVDHVVLNTPRERLWLGEQALALAAHPVLFVGVFCPPDELALREAQRGDRRPGQAQRQAQHQYQRSVYDLAVDTCASTSGDCVTLIQTALAQPATWQAFQAFPQSVQPDPHDDALHDRG